MSMIHKKIGIKFTLSYKFSETKYYQEMIQTVRDCTVVQSGTLLAQFTFLPAVKPRLYFSTS